MTRATLLVFLLASPAAAQEPRAEPPKAKEPARLDAKSLGAMLADMGVEPKLVDDRFQRVRWTIKNWDRPDWPVWLSVSGNKQTVWLYTEFELRADVEKTPADAWRKLLETNDEIAPAFFSLDEKGRRLTLRRPVPNADPTAAQLRKELNGFVETVRKTQDLWRPAAFLPVMTAEAQALVGKLAGAWRLTASTDRGKALAADAAGKFDFVFEKNQLRAYQDGKEVLRATVYVEVLDGRATFDFVGDAGTDLGILKLDGDTLTLCVAGGGAGRPTEFAGTEKSNSVLMVLKRQKP